MQLLDSVGVGALNAWLGTVPLTLVAVVYALAAPQGARLANASWFSVRERRLAIATGLFYFYLVGYSFTVPLAIGTAWFAVGAMVHAVGFVGALASYHAFGRAAPDQPVTRGIYRLSRHPMYLATVVALLGTATAGASVTLAALTALYALPLHWLASAEEAHCRTEYGAAYSSFQRSTRRYL